jgi:hypothetical protein
MRSELTKLTSVKVLKKNYTEFKKTTLNSDITFQKFVNRAIELYLTNDEFRSKIEIHNTGGIKNSKF